MRQTNLEQKVPIHTEQEWLETRNTGPSSRYILAQSLMKKLSISSNNNSAYKTVCIVRSTVD